MHLRAKIYLIISFLITIFLILSLLFYFRLHIFSYVLFQSRLNAQEKLLCKTDYKLLLEACRELPVPIEKPARIYYSAKSISKYPPEGMSNISKRIIIGLKPTLIFVDDIGRMVIDMGNSHWSFGIYAYSKDFNEPFTGFYYGDRELVTGLWYYDEQYEYKTGYGEEIEALIQKNKFQ